MVRCSHWRITVALLVPLAGSAVKATAQNRQSEFRPEADGYVNLNSTTRLFLVALFTEVLETGHRQGDFGVHFRLRA